MSKTPCNAIATEKTSPLPGEAVTPGELTTCPLSHSCTTCLARRAAGIPGHFDQLKDDCRNRQGRHTSGRSADGNKRAGELWHIVAAEDLQGTVGHGAAKAHLELALAERALGPLFEDLVDDPDARREFQDLVHESYESVHRGKPVTAIHRSVVTARLYYLTPDAWAEEMARQGAKPEKLHYEARLDALKKFTKGTDDEWLELPDVRRQELFRELREAFRLAHALPKMLGAAHQEQVLMSIALRGEEDDEQ